MNFTAYVLQTNIYLQTENGCRPDVMQVMLCNGNKVHVFGRQMDDRGFFVSGDLVEFSFGERATDTIDFDAEQAPNTYYKVNSGWSLRITNEATMKTFLLGAAILGAARERAKRRRECLMPFVRQIRRFIPAW